MPDFHREDDWWRHGQNLYLDNLEANGAVSGAVVSGAAGRCAAVLFWFIGAESRRHLLW
ncbi:tail component [Escherichia coli]|nr:tail component [Escherichia coli]